MTHFSFCQDPAVEAQMARIITELHAEIATMPEREWVECVVLGGGYGRGEGGVAPGSKLYNDLDLFVLPRAFEHLEAIRRAFDRSGHCWSEKLGIEVSYFIIPNAHWLNHNRQTLMVSDLVAGHVLIWGEGRKLEQIQVDFASIPWDEAARLMLNRGFGLMLCRQDCVEADFIVRNIQKAILGCGDALLIASGRYCAGADKRSLRLRESPFFRLYRAAADYKYHPDAIRFDDYPARLSEFDILWQETLDELLAMRRNQERISIKDLAKNVLFALKFFSCFPLFPLLEKPRVKLLRELRKQLNDPAVKPSRRLLKLWSHLS